MIKLPSHAPCDAFAAKVPVVGGDEIIAHLGGKMSKKNSGTVNSLFQAICKEY